MLPSDHLQVQAAQLPLTTGTCNQNSSSEKQFLTTAPLRFYLLSCGLQQDLRGWLTGQVNTPPKCGIFHFTIWKRQSPPPLPITPAAREARRCQGNLSSAVLLRCSRRVQGPIPSSPGQLNKLLSLSRLRFLDAYGTQAEPPQTTAHSQQGQRKAASGRKTQQQLQMDSRRAQGSVPSEHGLLSAWHLHANGLARLTSESSTHHCNAVGSCKRASKRSVPKPVRRKARDKDLHYSLPAEPQHKGKLFVCKQTFCLWRCCSPRISL